MDAKRVCKYFELKQLDVLKKKKKKAWSLWIFVKDYDKNEESSYLKYSDVNLYVCENSQKLLVDDLCVENTTQFNKDFTENYNEDNSE